MTGKEPNPEREVTPTAAGGTTAAGGEKLLILLRDLVQAWETATARGGGCCYRAYLHGQIHALCLALHTLFPGEGNWGEQAALLVRGRLVEHRCEGEE